MPEQNPPLEGNAADRVRKTVPRVGPFVKRPDLELRPIYLPARSGGIFKGFAKVRLG